MRCHSVSDPTSSRTILALHVFDTAAVGPTFSDGQSSVVTGQNTTMAAVVYGLNYTTYFMPVNVYLSLSAGLSRLQLQVDNTIYGSKSGFGGRVQAGKEWFVSDNWGLGVAANFTYTRNANGDSAGTVWTTLAGAVVFSATFN